MAGPAQQSALNLFTVQQSSESIFSLPFYRRIISNILHYSTAVCNNQSNVLIKNVEQKGISHND